MLRAELGLGLGHRRVWDWSPIGRIGGGLRLRLGPRIEVSRLLIIADSTGLRFASITVTRSLMVFCLENLKSIVWGFLGILGFFAHSGVKKMKKKGKEGKK